MVEITAEQLKRIELLLQGVPADIEKALYGVVNRTRTTVKSETIKGIKRTYAIKHGDIRAESNIKLKTTKTGGGVIGQVIFAGAAIPLMRFSVSPQTPTPRPDQNVSVGVEKGTKKRLDNAFIAQMRSGHLGVFERLPGEYMRNRPNDTRHSEKIGSNARFRTDQFYGPSVSKMAERESVRDEAEAAAMATMGKRVEHEISRILNRYGGR
ncbi:MAG: phage tail protein [Defluviitaleaceae bacterium]|nr:phage tail protein [Defluviitaleaceae bacterium]